MHVFFVFFLLASGDLFKRKLVKIAGPSLERRKVTVQILDEINAQIERFLLVLLLGRLVAEEQLVVQDPGVGDHERHRHAGRDEERARLDPQRVGQPDLDPCRRRRVGRDRRGGAAARREREREDEDERSERESRRVSNLHLDLPGDGERRGFSPTTAIRAGGS